MAKRVIEELVYEYWDCRYCGATGIRGDKNACASCGHPRDKDISFYRKDDHEEQVVDEKQKQRFEAGADWVCPFCDALNPAIEAQCGSCGAGRVDSEDDYFDVQQRKAEKAALAAAAVAAPPKKSVLRKLLWIAGGLFAAFLALGWWAGMTHEVPYEVVAARWERTIQIERYQWTQSSDWQDELKGDDIQKLSEAQEIRRYERRAVGSHTESYTEQERYQSGTREDCNTRYVSQGSGASKKVTECDDVPVYSYRTVTKTRQVTDYQDFPIHDTKVTYRSKLYRPLRLDEAKGVDNNPRWPDMTPGTGEDAKPDRQTTRTESYIVDLRKADAKADGPETPRIKTTELRFSQHYLLGQKVKMLVNNLDKLALEKDDTLEEGLATEQPKS